MFLVTKRKKETIKKAVSRLILSNWLNSLIHFSIGLWLCQLSASIDNLLGRVSLFLFVLCCFKLRYFIVNTLHFFY